MAREREDKVGVHMAVEDRSFQLHKLESIKANADSFDEWNADSTSTAKEMNSSRYDKCAPTVVGRIKDAPTKNMCLEASKLTM